MTVNPPAGPRRPATQEITPHDENSCAEVVQKAPFGTISQAIGKKAANPARHWHRPSQKSAEEKVIVASNGVCESEL